MTETNEPPAEVNADVTSVPLATNSRVVEADALFAGEQEILIRNGSDIYRLRRTRHGKLILHK
jgi:hemin uptake protein HemP